MKFFRMKRRPAGEVLKVGSSRGSSSQVETESKQGLLLRHVPTSSKRFPPEQVSSMLELPPVRAPRLPEASDERPSFLLPQNVSQGQTPCPPTQVVTLKALIHCQGCLRKVKKALSKLQGVNTYHVDIKQQKVTVVGQVREDEVFQCVSKVVKGTQLLSADEKSIGPNNVAI
ncbi:hypothetical protein KP509_16G064800 [Ceratopteris richardii]|uniref:HMA domain-containing protein n=1 Tax=Ceratopteris richardii TaxID=49495 RepID=A0A8T2T333_CERRI|nr:hypothetical protein KP509_16G064800 [Ceratopteris richardii]